MTYVVTQYCVDCHQGDDPEGGLALDQLISKPLVDETDGWEVVLRRLRARQMPPVAKRTPRERHREIGRRALSHPPR